MRSEIVTEGGLRGAEMVGETDTEQIHLLMEVGAWVLFQVSAPKCL